MRTTLRGRFSGTFIHHLERLFQHGTATGLTEGELLERFVASEDESAFEALIERHGPMVLGICRRLLRDPNDVDDAFQATFLVLVRKAGTLRRRDLLGNWLYGVAHRVATRSRCLAAKRLARVPHGQDTLDRLDADESGAVATSEVMPEVDAEPSPWLHEEVRRLPEKYRTLVLLCYFEGLTHEQAAARLGCPVGTVKGRLARARDLLRKRLTRRGITLSAAALAADLARAEARAAVPESLKSATVEAARAVAGTAGSSIVAGSSVSLPVATLAQGVLQAMIMSKLKAAAITLLVTAAVTTGAVISAAQGVARKKSYPDPNAASSGPATKSESSASSGPAGAGGQAHGGTGSGGVTATAFEGGGGGNFAEVEFEDRLTIAPLGAELAATESNPRNDAVLKALDEPLTLSFDKPIRLRDVLKYIKTTLAKSGRPPLPIYVDPKGLEDAEAKPEATVIIDLEGAPLKSSLRLLLKQLGLAYCVRDGVIIISSVEGVRQELAEAARELFGSGNEEIMPTLQHLGILGQGRARARRNIQ